MWENMNMRPLKKPRLGPPDVYPQEAKQREDELTSTHVKHGFATEHKLSEEFGTARNCNVTASKVGAYFNAILARKDELMTLTDSGRKKQQINPKDNFWPVTARNKATLDTWFKDLAGTKPLSSLAKKAPSFNKKEEIFAMLCENQVTMQRAAWFIKLSSAYTVAVSEAKIKKRQMPDPATEWTGTLIKFMKDLIPKLLEHYHQGPSSDKSSSNVGPAGGMTPNSSLNANPVTIPPPLSSPAGSLHSPASSSLGGSVSQGQNLAPPSPQEEQKLALKQWNYCTQLCKYMYEEGLLDRAEFLNWVLDLLDKMKSSPSSDDGILRIYLPLAMQYLSDIVQSERFSRRLAYAACKKLAHLINTMADSHNLSLVNHELNSSKQDSVERKEKPTDKSSKDADQKPDPTPVHVNPFDTIFSEYMNCSHHHDLVLQLSSIIQVITLECPTALVWCGVGETRSSSVLAGSPLDHLPVAPSALPMPSRCTKSNEEVRKRLSKVEESIKLRSRHAESRWCVDKWQTVTGNASLKILAVLDALDGHCFDRMDSNNSLDTLYQKIFPPLQLQKEAPTANGTNGGPEAKDASNKHPEYFAEQDASIVNILCEWTVSWQRWGEHRAMAVAWLLDKRQNEVFTTYENESANNGNSNDDKDSVISGGGPGGGLPIFQSILMKFLDEDAPILEEHSTQQNRSQFTNLVHLFSELIRHDVFSHDAYMCTLISRGDLLTGTGMSLLDSHSSCNAGLGTGPISNKPTSSSPNINQGIEEDVIQNDFKAKLEDLDDSNVDDDLDKLLQHIKEDQQNSMDAPDSPKDPEHAAPQVDSATNKTESSSRHFLYTEHFPLCQDDPIAQHDCNQRYILLYGVGKERDDKKHAVKKMTKEICKLFSKKFSIDVAEGGKVKKHSRNEFNFEATSNKSQSMSYFDQHMVTWQCAVQVQEMLNSFALGNSNYLPVQEHVAFLFDLMESAFNIYGLIDTCIQILKELPEVELQLMSKNSVLVKSYTTSLSLYVVGVLRRYHCCLLLSAEQTTAIFEGLCRIVKHVTNPSDCSSAERCILAYLYDLYSACSSLKTRPQQEPFHNAYPKIKQALYTPLQPTPSVHTYNPQFMVDVITNPRRGGKIELSWARQLNESASNRYSFVCNAVIAVTRDIDNDTLNDIAAMCAELTACCNALSTEWLGVLIALCGSSKDAGYYLDVITQVDILNTNIHNALSVFTSILVARHCFSLENFVAHVALPALVQACKGRSETTPEIEAGARLSCHLLLRLFKTIEYPQPGLYSVSTSPNPITTTGQVHNIKLSCDRHLLAAAHKNIGVAPVLAVLKGILVVGDATAQKVQTSIFGSGKRSGLNTPVHPGSTPKHAGDLSHILGTSDLSILGNTDESMLDLTQTNTNQDSTTSLSDFAQHVLRQICSQEWVLERCLQNADELCQQGMLIDNMLTAKQAQRLLHMICYPENESNLIADMDQKAIIVRILENLEQWSLRISWLDLQLMFKQTNCSSPELSNWLDMVARAAIDVFQVHECNSMEHFGGNGKNEKLKPSIWLVAPLVAKLPSAVQGRILKVAGQVLESTNMFSKSKDSGGGNNSSIGSQGGNSNSSISSNGSVMAAKQSAQLNHQPFLGLVLTCLKGQDEQKEGLLQSLYTQLSQFLQNRDLETVGGIEDPLGFEKMLDALQLRYSLVGGLFDAIQKNSTSTSDWAILFAQLISQGVIDLSNNSELFTTTLDMLATLIHSTLVSDSQSERDETKKQYTNLMKKLRKELGERNNSSIKYVRQLLPLAKQTCEVIACEPAGSSTDAKGNKINIDSIEKKHGLRLTDKQRVSVWDLLEGHKNPAPLSWAWFGAVKIERKPLAYEETHRLLKFHTHSLVKPSSYYYEPLPLPPEDLEPLPDKLKDDMKADTPTSDQSPAPTGKKGKSQTRKRKPKGATTPQNQQSVQGIPGQQHLGGQQTMQPGQQQPNQVTGQQQQQQQVTMTPQQTMQQLQNANLGQMTMGGQMGQLNLQHMQQQYQQQNQGQMMVQQMAQQQGIGQQQAMGQNQVGGIGAMMGGPQQQQQPGPNQMGFVGAGSGGGVNAMAAQMAGQGAGAGGNQQWGGYNPMQQQQQQQQQQQMFYNQGMGQPGMNRFDRPQLNTNPKQVLSNMLRARIPMGGANPGAANFIQQPVRSQQPFMRGPSRPGIPNPMVGSGMGAGAGGSLMGQSGGNIIQTNLLNQQNAGLGQGMNANLGNAGMGGNAMMSQAAGNANAGGMGNPGMMGMQNMPQSGNMNPGMVNQGMNPTMGGTGIAGSGMIGQNGGNANSAAMGNPGMMGMQSMQQGGMQTGMFQGQGGPYQSMNQNYPNYGTQGMGQQGGQGMIGNFNQLGQQQRNTQAEYIAQQRALAARGGQYGQHAPNVTMNNMVNQGAVPPYPRQGGKPGATAAQTHQFQQQQRLRQQMMMQQQQQQQQGMAQQGNAQSMVSNQGQGISQQQTPNLVAQLQRQMPNQGSMMGQQYSHQPPPY
ncbi:mediator of RNA polymerase II transcription subunit 12 isoform X2 [Topomyia yanbarensis]|uniref:mediator of RNA polymerase II transcription subunit 12 isoform X2 n=1 Tax=Topomyia yanbarensis TaxID=2498891 RepID=UPI00273C5A10|nr:mediator of RNA polymerase II transcription subunit 12 isoform X2 [Topomyia yanbarensis]